MIASGLTCCSLQNFLLKPSWIKRSTARESVVCWNRFRASLTADLSWSLRRNSIGSFFFFQLLTKLQIEKPRWWEEYVSKTHTKTTNVGGRIYNTSCHRRRLLGMNARLFCRILEGFVDEAHNCHSVAPGVFEIDGCLAIARHYQGERLVKPPTDIVLLLLTTACYFKVFLLNNFFFQKAVGIFRGHYDALKLDRSDQINTCELDCGSNRTPRKIWSPFPSFTIQDGSQNKRTRCETIFKKRTR